MHLASTIQAQPIFLPKRSCQERQTRLHLAPRANLAPLADVATSLGPIENAAVLALPAIGGAVLTVLAAKFAAYSQLEVVRTGMLSRHVKAKDARVLQLGGTTRDLFYYPNGTVQVTAAEENLKDGLWEQAGMQAGVPVRPLKSSSASALSNSAGAAFDSVVAFDQLGSITEYKKYFSDVWRVLKPGGTFIFIQRVSGSPVSSLVRLGGPPATAPEVGDVIANSQSWDFIQWDVASGALDPHIVGVAIKPLKATSKTDFSVDNAAFEQVMKAKQWKSKKKGSGSDGGSGSRQKGFGS
ncbi:hypothetical protein Ndes2526B_g03614 [Nannochloris sp. 'desiccata']|nr:hypothetical protein NADE_006538 [Chlorella desiccata (nom. nud.)]